MARRRTRLNRTLAPVFLYTSLFLGSASAQVIDVVGKSETLEIATWNIEWFGATGSGQGPTDVALQRANVRRVIAESAIDLWAVQEISDTGQFDALMSELGPPWVGELATNSGQQRVGFIFNTDTIKKLQIQHVLETFEYEFAYRPPLQFDVNVVLPDTTVTFTFITLHMKCCGDASSYSRRVDAAGRLKTHIDFNHVTLGKPIAAVLGDFNDELTGSIYFGHDTPYRNFLNDPDHYRFLTLPMNEQNVPTWCSNSVCTAGSTLDQILITDEVFSHYVDASVGRLTSALDAIFGYTYTTSDHLPVYAVFSFPTNTAVARGSQPPAALHLENLYPNPVRDEAFAEISSRAGEPVSVSIFDALGRRVRTESRTMAAGRTSVRFQTTDLAHGLYLLRVSSDTESVVRTFVKTE